MTKIMSWGSGLFSVLAVILIVFGVKDVLVPADGPILTAATQTGVALPSGQVDPATIRVDLGNVLKGVLTPFEVKLTNVSPGPARIAGIPIVCVNAGCIVVESHPETIRSNTTATLRLACDAKVVGPFRLETAIYLDFGEPTGVSVPITVVANVVDSVKTD